MTNTTSIAHDFLAMVDVAAQRLALPKVKDVWLPQPRLGRSKNAEFGVVILEDGSVGLFYALLGDTLDKLSEHRLSDDIWTGADPVSLARGFGDTDPLQKAIGLGAINAISQHLIRISGCQLDTETNSIASFQPHPDSHLGMVGFFPTLVERLRAQSIELTVVELQPELVRQDQRFRVTLDPKALQDCNLILCTSTMLLTDSIDQILTYCEQADQVAVIGPSAGFMPDPLFARGVHTVGGHQVTDVDVFLSRCQADKKWGRAARKYCLHRTDYPGYMTLLNRL